MIAVWPDSPNRHRPAVSHCAHVPHAQVTSPKEEYFIVGRISRIFQPLHTEVVVVKIAPTCWDTFDGSLF